MTCRHPPGYHAAERQYEQDRQRILSENTPDAKQYVIEEVVRIGEHLVMKVRYPNCVRCSYEGVKVMVFLNATESQALRWKVMDPHFRDPKTPRQPNEAPGPDARFPASPEGWDDAINYAQSKARLPGRRGTSGY